MSYPRGAQIYLNLENTTNSNRTVMLGWVKNWAAEVKTAGYVAGGYLTAFPSDRTAPVASNINFLAKQNITDQVIVPIGRDGRVVLYNQSPGTTDLIADVAGYLQN